MFVQRNRVAVLFTVLIGSVALPSCGDRTGVAVTPQKKVPSFLISELPTLVASAETPHSSSGASERHRASGFSQTQDVPDPHHSTEFIGSYFLGDGLGVCLSLSLMESGYFECSYSGCGTTYGTSQGRWVAIGNTIHLDAVQETGTLKERPVQSIIALRDNGKLFLVQESRRDHFLATGPTDLNCFVRVADR